MTAKNRCTRAVRHVIHRARYYNPATGTFNQIDPFEGDTFDPQSLHKYAFASLDPVNGTDPSGEFTLVEVMVVVAIIAILVAGCDKPPSAPKAVQPALITGGTPKNIAKRKKIDEIARKYNGSTLWAQAGRKDDFSEGSNKCNKFVYDVTKEAAAEALVTVPDRGRTVERPPLAGEWADRNTRIPNWRMVEAGEQAQPGDVAAYKLTGGGTRYSGHTGFIVTGGNMSAHATIVSPDPGQFENNRDTRYRRYTGE